MMLRLTGLNAPASSTLFAKRVSMKVICSESKMTKETSTCVMVEKMFVHLWPSSLVQNGRCFWSYFHSKML